MGLNVTEKIINSHIVDGKPVKGSEVGLRIDQTLTQDATGTMAYLQFESMKVDRVKTELSVSYIDHNTVQIGFENADDHMYLQTSAAKYGAVFSKAGNGICHQVHLERFGKPSKTLLGSDSHTPTGGGLGMIAIGAGGLDVAVAMAGGCFYLTYPKIINIHLVGRLNKWVSAKDVILKVLSIIGTKGNVGSVLEYGGPGIDTLSVPERATITNMGAECGVTTSVFPSDETTRKFLHSQQRQSDWVEIKPDNDAVYDRIIEIDLSRLEPLAATPHSPGNISRVREIAGLEVHQVCLGSCTNSSYKDLMIVANILDGRKADKNVSFVIAPGSKQVLENIIRDGALEKLLSAGVRIAESACGFCIGNSMSPQNNSVSLRTSNRNFLGRSGTKSADVYLVSPETAAAAVLTGKITDPRSLEKMGIEYPSVAFPEKFYIDDGLLVYPVDIKGSREVYRGPNIGAPPRSEPFCDTISGKVAIKVDDKITTDHIIPAGEKMKYRSNVQKYSEYLFEVVDSGFYSRAKEIKDSGLHNIIVAGFSYGQGSSREHAALCPMFMGVKAVIAKSIERIHKDNLINFGILPLNFENNTDYEQIEQGDAIQIEDIVLNLKEGRSLRVKNLTKGDEFNVVYELSDRQKKVLLGGGKLEYMRQGS